MQSKAYLLANLIVGNDWNSKGHSALQRAQKVHVSRCADRSVDLLRVSQIPESLDMLTCAPFAESPVSTEQIKVSSWEKRQQQQGLEDTLHRTTHHERSLGECIRLTSGV